MNKFVIVFLIFAPISFNILSETYVCSQEMSNYGKPGEINTIQFRREGSNFVHGKLGHVYEVSEYSSIIILTSIVSIKAVPDKAVDLVMIDKISKEWKRQVLTFVKKNIPTEGGKCVVVN